MGEEQTSVENFSDDRKLFIDKFGTCLYKDIKKKIHHFATNIEQEEINVNQVSRMDTISQVNFSTLDDMLEDFVRDPSNTSFLGIGKGKSKKSDHHQYIRIQNDENILLITPDLCDCPSYFRCSDALEMALESFHLESTLLYDTTFRSAMFHNCLQNNFITRDTYFIVRHIIKAIFKVSPEVKTYFTLLEIDIKKDFMMKKYLKKNPGDCFVKFIRKIKELKLDYNIIINIANIDRSFDSDAFDSFGYALRAASPDIPSFLKFVFTISST